MWNGLPKSPRKKQVSIKALAKKSGIIHSEKQLSNNVTSTETAQLVKNFFTHSGIGSTMPGIKYEVSIWENGAKKHETKYYLIIIFWEVYRISTEFPVKGSFDFVWFQFVFGTFLCNNTTNSQCWQGNCEDCADGKKVIENIDSGKIYELTDLGIIYTFQVSHAP